MSIGKSPPSAMVDHCPDENVSANSGCSWLLDIEVSHHITSNPGTLAETAPYIGYEGVFLGNDHKIPIKNIG